MTEKKKSEAKKPATTQRFSDVAKELGIEVKALLALVDQFVVAGFLASGFFFSVMCAGGGCREGGRRQDYARRPLA